MPLENSAFADVKAVAERNLHLYKKVMERRERERAERHAKERQEQAPRDHGRQKEQQV